MTIKLFIDNMVWDIFYAEKIDLSKELPIEEFSLYMTREAEFEIPLMPPEKRNYVESFINDGGIETDTLFGFHTDGLSPEEQRVGGFGDINNPKVGVRFISEAEASIIDSESATIGPRKRPTGLLTDEADVSLAARSVHFAVLTCDGKKSLKRAQKKYGGLIIDLKKYEKGTSIANFIKSELANLKQKIG